jgi:tetratricopeptide (TPR) repeat protein
VLYDRLGNATRAVPEFERAVKEHPRDADLLNDLGYHHYNLGRWAEAEKTLRQAVEINPKHTCAWTNLGMTLAQQGRTRESLEAFGHCVGPAEAQCNLGFLLTTQGKREEAKSAYHEALRLEPGLQLAKSALAKLEEPAGHGAAAPDAPTAGTQSSPWPSVHVAPPSAGKADMASGVEPHSGGIQLVEARDPLLDPLNQKASDLADGSAPPALPRPADLPALKTSGWVIPSLGHEVASKPGPGASAPVSLAPPLPAPSTTAKLSAGDAGDGLHWLPPPPVPPPALSADLQPLTRTPASAAR